MDGFTALFGEPEGIIISQLIWATQYTIYLSAIAFLGGGLFKLNYTFQNSPNKV